MFNTTERMFYYLFEREFKNFTKLFFEFLFRRKTGNFCPEQFWILKFLS